MTLIAQITDMHIRPSGKKAYGVVDTEAMLRAAVASIAAQPRQPDLVIASGDLTDCGLVEEYELLRDILAPLAMPVRLLPGNHDRRENLRLVFGDRGLSADERRAPALHHRGSSVAHHRARHRRAGQGPWRDGCAAARLAERRGSTSSPIGRP